MVLSYQPRDGLVRTLVLQVAVLGATTDIILRQVAHGATQSAYMLAAGLAVMSLACLTLRNPQGKRLGLAIGLIILQAALIIGSDRFPGSAPLEEWERVLPFAYPFVFGSFVSMLSERTYRRQRPWVVAGFLAVALITAAYIG